MAFGDGPLSARQPMLPPSTSSAPAASAPSEAMHAPPAAPTLPSVRRDSVPASNRRDSMPPLRPISVPPDSLPGLLQARSSSSGLEPAPDSTRGRLLATAVAGLALSAGVAFAKPIAPSRSVDGIHADALYRTRLGKEISGLAVVALVVVGLVLSLRKRWRRFPYGDVARLRVLHGALGAAALVGLACHTGCHLGERLNRLLSLDLLVACALGGLAAAATALGDPVVGRLQRLFATRAHLYVLLPLPVLLALHVLGAYYF
jgi:hypothetical protein